jgi:integrase
VSKVGYFIKKPSKTRRSFAVVGYRPLGGVRTYFTPDDDKITVILSAHKSGILSDRDAEEQLKRVIAELKRQNAPRYVANAANLKLLDEYWRAAYEGRHLVDKGSAYNRLRRAVESCGAASVIGPRDQIKVTGSSRQVRARVSALNQIRKHFGVQEKLFAPPPVLPKFRYLSEEEFQKAVAAEDDPIYRALFMTLFYCGARVSEALAFEEHLLRPKGTLVISGQLGKGGVKPTKNRKVRTTVMWEQGRESFRVWCRGRDEKIDRSIASKRFKQLCISVFKKEDKHCSIHDLRHSFAVYSLTRKSVSISILAKLLGNSVKVCEDYYLNFALDDDLLEHLLSR